MAVINQTDFWQRAVPLAIERKTQIAIADLLRAACRPGWWWSHIGHGEARSEATGALLKRMGLRKGIADFLLIAPDGVHHWLELKRGNAPLTPEQQDFAAMLRARNVPHGVARSYDAAVAQLKAWGAL